MGIRLNFNIGFGRVSIGKSGIRFYGNTAQQKTKTLNPRISVSEKGKGFSFPLSPKKGRGIRWWF